MFNPLLPLVRLDSRWPDEWPLAVSPNPANAMAGSERNLVVVDSRGARSSGVLTTSSSSPLSPPCILFSLGVLCSA